ncbi:hypothetical protein MPLDJ20_310035 [Mesorhizobium plurifarium]|uniref:Uncharacterized protein n=1 Tax=Mesorhizobium plurifarium TaxID=69974 RepID=A0A090FH34_MESPL|nr:hypothetical protein MPLDJ20_310035 [Mesorhizobium plurifarium]
MILLDLEAGFEDAGFEFVGISSATSATATFDANPEQFKALVTGIRLGRGKSGWDVARHPQDEAGSGGTSRFNKFVERSQKD